MTYDDAPCPFCQRIAQGDCRTAGSGVVCFEPLNLVTLGHMLFVPIVHVADAAEVPSVAECVMYYASLHAQKRGRDANLITSIGPAATQTIRHLHIHYVPRSEGDGLVLPWTEKRSVTVR